MLMAIRQDDHAHRNELDSPDQTDADRGERPGVTRTWPPPTPYLSHRLCVTRRLDLLMSRRVRDMRTLAMPPLC